MVGPNQSDRMLFMSGVPQGQRSIWAHCFLFCTVYVNKLNIFGEEFGVTC